MSEKVKLRKFGLIGTVFGGLALTIAVLHFFLGPIEQAPTIEEFVAEKAASLSEALQAGLKGEGLLSSTSEVRRLGPDQALETSVAALSVVALLLAAWSYIQREDFRPAGTAVLLGGAALTFQVAIAVVGAILAVMLIGAILGAIGGG